MLQLFQKWISIVKFFDKTKTMEKEDLKMAEFDAVKMDLAAATAEGELSNIPDEDIEVVCRWFAKHYMQAGYKRLGRILAANGKRLEKGRD